MRLVITTVSRESFKTRLKATTCAPEGLDILQQPHGDVVGLLGGSLFTPRLLVGRPPSLEAKIGDAAGAGGALR